MAAGFTQKDAALLALSTASVDHNPNTIPTSIANITSGRTAKYHFPSFKDALKNVEIEISYGQGMGLKSLGIALHGLEDVGFIDAPGPHRGKGS